MVAVVGAVAIDLVAMRERFLDGTSNPSDISLGLGGVGWRIYSNLSVPRRFVTALAADPVSRWAREALAADGDVRVEAVSDRAARPPLYLALMESGHLKVGASDFRIVEQSLSYGFVAEALGTLGLSDFLVLDANISPALLARLVREHAARTRVVFEPVSVEKARRHAASLRGVYLVTPTEEEAEALAPRGVAAFMAETGARHVLVTRGRRGTVLHGDGGVAELVPAAVVDAGDTTGAGDLLLACLLSRLHAGEPVRDAVRGALGAVEERLAGGGA